MIVRKILLMCLYLFIPLSLVGCKDDKGNDFVGHWYEVTEKKNPTDIDISYKSGVFHVDENRAYIGARRLEYSVNKMEAKADSDDVISGKFFTMRIEGGKLFYNGEVYVKK